MQGAFGAIIFSTFRENECVEKYNKNIAPFCI